MTSFFNHSDTLRSVVGAIAAVVLGGTFLVAAAGPAVAGTASQVNIAAESNIVRGN
jgi:hypothetical protein